MVGMIKTEIDLFRSETVASADSSYQTSESVVVETKRKPEPKVKGNQRKMSSRNALIQKKTKAESKTVRSYGKKPTKITSESLHEDGLNNVDDEWQLTTKLVQTPSDSEESGMK